jgi:hypothetical protein
MAGGFFGGLAEGVETSRQQGIQQQQVDQQGQYQQGMLQIQQQAQKNQQQRQLFEQADKDISNIMSSVQKTIEAGKLAGKDNLTISKTVQPMIEAATKLATSAGRKDAGAVINAQVAAALSNPAYQNPQAASPSAPAAPGAASPTPPTAPGGPSASSPSDIPAQPSGTGPQPPGQNITSQNIVKVEPQQAEVDKWTKALMTLPATAPPGMKDAIKARLDSAISLNNPDATVHFAKQDDGSELPVVITKRGGQVSITDTKGNPYEPPTTADGGSNSDAIAQAIIDGKQPPTTTGLYKQGAAVKAKLARQGFDMTSANLEWQAAQKQVHSLNGPQMTRYAGLAKSVVNTIDEVKSLSEQLQNSGVPLANAAKLQAYMQTAGNTPNGQLAAKYLAGINTLKEEFANLAQGGYAPTESAWALANQQINGNYGVQQLSATLTEVQRLIRYRLQGIPNFQTLGPDAPNRYKPDGGGGQGHGDGAAKPSVPPPPAGFVVMSP